MVNAWTKLEARAAVGRQAAVGLTFIVQFESTSVQIGEKDF